MGRLRVLRDSWYACAEVGSFKRNNRRMKEKVIMQDKYKEMQERRKEK